MKIAEVEPTELSEWLKGRPQVIHDMAKRWPPGVLYRLNPTGQRVYIIGYSEDGTVRVNVDARYNFLAFEREVFGVDPNDLEECDGPAPDEPVGEASAILWNALCGDEQEPRT